MKGTLVALTAMLLAAVPTFACTNLIVTRGASADGSVIVSYSADSHQLYGELYFWPRATYPAHSLYKVYEWDTGRYMGEIPEVEQTYNVLGNMNEYQLLIGETTFGGRRECADPDGMIDYGTLIYLSLLRCKTAREAIALMDNLVQTYGYASGGESFSIADPNEVWIMEIMAKSPKIIHGVNVNKGAVWVAKRIPDGMISGHANQARITGIDFHDKENCLYSPDVVSYAREMGFFEGRDEDFSFADAYAPLDFGAMRACEARVWAFFNRFADGMDAYVDYAMGYDASKRFPLYVKPNRKLSVKDVADMMRDHYEDTPMDMRYDVGAGGNELPYRWRPMNFTVDGEKYIQERAIATQQTGWWFVGQCRNWIPEGLGGLYWFAVDDAGTSALTPIYTCSTAVPPCLKVGNGSMLEYSETSMFWLNNRISQFAYLRYNQIGAEVRQNVDSWEEARMQEIEAIDRAAIQLWSLDKDKALAFLTHYTVNTAQALFSHWQQLDKYLMVKYIDGNIKRQNPDGSFRNNGYKESIPVQPRYGGYTQHFLKKVVDDHGEVLREAD